MGFGGSFSENVIPGTLLSRFADGRERRDWIQFGQQFEHSVIVYEQFEHQHLQAK
jgi:hypothetical protein